MARRLYLYIAIFWTLAITYGSLASGNPEVVKKVFITDKIAHVVGYFLLCIWWLLSLHYPRRNTKNVALVSIAVFVYGIIIEALQGTFTTNRQADYIDILANSVGIFSAMLVFFKFFRKKGVN